MNISAPLSWVQFGVFSTTDLTQYVIVDKCQLRAHFLSLGMPRSANKAYCVVTRLNPKFDWRKPWQSGYVGRSLPKKIGYVPRARRRPAARTLLCTR